MNKLPKLRGRQFALNDRYWVLGTIGEVAASAHFRLFV
jgi:hypothetical protein